MMEKAANNSHGIDHIGLTVPDIDVATAFFKAAFEAVVLYDNLTKAQSERKTADTQQRLGVSNDKAERAIRMLALPNGPGLELFEFRAATQDGPITPGDIGWQHIAIYVDDIAAAVAKLEAAGGKRNADPQPLGDWESGAGNQFCYCQTPWGSTLELITYPSRQPYLDQASRRKWSV